MTKNRLRVLKVTDFYTVLLLQSHVLTSILYTSVQSRLSTPVSKVQYIPRTYFLTVLKSFSKSVSCKTSILRQQDPILYFRRECKGVGRDFTIFKSSGSLRRHLYGWVRFVLYLWSVFLFQFWDSGSEYIDVPCISSIITFLVGFL